MSIGSNSPDIRPQIEQENLTASKIAFVGNDSSFLGTVMDKIIQAQGMSPVFSPDHLVLKKTLADLEKRGISLPKFVVADTASAKTAEYLNGKGIAIIVINQNPKKDLSYLTVQNEQRKVKNEVIPATPQDFKTPQALITKVAEAIVRLRNPTE